MQLHLAFLSVQSSMSSVRMRVSGVVRHFPVRIVDAILLTRSTGISTDAALLAVENDTSVLLIDTQTHYPLEQLSSGRPSTIAAVRKDQAFFARSAAGLARAAGCITEKVARQHRLLRHWAEYPTTPEEFTANLPITDRIPAAIQREPSKCSQANPNLRSPKLNFQYIILFRVFGQASAALCRLTRASKCL